jgi:hypothetical protein
MQSQKPPAVATWLLEHLIPGTKDGALAGDLLEEFGRRRSAAWYWRQVVLAIFVGLAKELRLLWVAAGGTLLWVCAIFAFPLTVRDIMRSSPFVAVTDWGVRLDFPFSAIYGMAVFSLINTAPLAAGLGVYLVSVKLFTPGKFSQCILAGWITITFSSFGWVLLPSSPHPRAGSFLSCVIVSLPLFFGLVAAIWLAQPRSAGGTLAKSGA